MSLERATVAMSTHIRTVDPSFYLLTIAFPIAVLFGVILTSLYCYRWKRRRMQDVDRQMLLLAREQQQALAQILTREHTVVNITGPLQSVPISHRPPARSTIGMEADQLDVLASENVGDRQGDEIHLLQSLLAQRARQRLTAAAAGGVGRRDPYSVPLPQPLRSTDRRTEIMGRSIHPTVSMTTHPARSQAPQTRILTQAISSSNQPGASSAGESPRDGSLQMLIREGPWVTLRTLRRAVPEQPYLPLYVEEARVRRADNVNGPVYSLEPQLMLYHNGEFVWIPASEANDMMGLAMLLTLANLQLDTGPPPASSETIDALPDAVITEQQTDVGLRCNVCFEDFTVSESVRRLQCNHYYHSDCIVPWLQTSGTCPICRESVGTSAEVSSREDPSADAVLL